MATRKRPASTVPYDVMWWPLGARPQVELGRHTGPQAVGVGDLRGANAATVLAAIRAAPEPPRLAGVAEQTKLSRPTVEGIVEGLVRSGLVADAPMPSAAGLISPGRPARRFTFQPRAAFVLGVDVRAYAINACVSDLAGEVLVTERRKVRRDLTGAGRAKAMLQVVHQVLNQAGLQPDQVSAAVVGTPGWVEDNARIRYVDNLKDWADVDIAGLLRESLGCPVAVENDANLAAVGEQWRGVGSATDDLVFVLVGERVGAGIIAGGRPLHGYRGAAGEIGFTMFEDGNRLSAPAIGRAGAQRPGIDPGSLYSDAAVVRHAAKGQDEAIADLQSVGARLAEALAPALLVLDPELVVVGTSLFGRPDLDAAAQYVLQAAEQQAATLLVDPPRWQLSMLGDDAILSGAVRFALAAIDNILLSKPLSLSEK